MTYGELHKLWLDKHPELTSLYNDYRPAEGAYALRVWFIDGISAVYTYNPGTDSFTIRND